MQMVSSLINMKPVRCKHSVATTRYALTASTSLTGDTHSIASSAAAVDEPFATALNMVVGHYDLAGNLIKDGMYRHTYDV